MKKQLGNLGKLRIDIDQPMEMNFDTEFNKIVLLVGMNGSGKSMMLKLHWALGTIMAYVLGAKKAGVTVDTKAVTQYIMDGTFSDQNFNGLIVAYFEKGTLEIRIENGKVTQAGYELSAGVEEAATPVFMSGTLRKFSEIDQYLKTEKIVTREKMPEMYRLYDIVFVERLKSMLAGGYKAPETFKKSMLSFDGMDRYDFDTFSIENETVYFADKEGKKRALSSLSAGEQSLVNMILANS